MMKEYKMLFSDNEQPYIICYEMDTSVITETSGPGNTEIRLYALNVPAHNTANDQEVERTIARIATNAQAWVNEHSKELIANALFTDEMTAGNIMAFDGETGQMMDPVQLAAALSDVKPAKQVMAAVPAKRTLN